MVKEKQWQEFDFTKESIKIHVEWCPKDFTAYYDSDYGQLRYGLHIMLSCPKKFSQKILQGQKRGCLISLKCHKHYFLDIPFFV